MMKVIDGVIAIGDETKKYTHTRGFGNGCDRRGLCHRD